MQIDPQDLSDQQVFEFVARPRVICHQQNAAGCSEDKQGSDQCFLYVRETFFRPCQHDTGQHRSRNSCKLGRNTVHIPAHCTRSNHTESGRLRHGQIYKYDASLQNLATQRHMGRQHD